MPSIREDLAWAAGFFDGEGCTTYHGGAHQKLYPRLRAGQSGKNGDILLKKFLHVVGVGKVYGPYKVAKNQRKVRWVYAVAGHTNVSSVVNSLWPWLGKEKRQQAHAVLNKRRLPFRT